MSAQCECQLSVKVKFGDRSSLVLAQQTYPHAHDTQYIRLSQRDLQWYTRACMHMLTKMHNAEGSLLTGSLCPQILTSHSQKSLSSASLSLAVNPSFSRTLQHFDFAQPLDDPFLCMQHCS